MHFKLNAFNLFNILSLLWVSYVVTQNKCILTSAKSVIRAMNFKLFIEFIYYWARDYFANKVFRLLNLPNILVGFSRTQWWIESSLVSSGWLGFWNNHHWQPKWSSHKRKYLLNATTQMWRNKFIFIKHHVI